ncbi:hypothetical protein NMY22_g14258 [Coprinellus aureogranulatus]|nr:hypothetical protein NMY22_g14258 [Coprinellus aureogranulatus]
MDQDQQEDELDIPLEPGYRPLDKSYWCNCEALCHGIMKRLQQRAYYYHTGSGSSSARGRTRATRDSGARPLRGMEANGSVTQDAEGQVGVGLGAWDDGGLGHFQGEGWQQQDDPEPPPGEGTPTQQAEPEPEPGSSNSTGPTAGGETLPEDQLEGSGLDENVVHRLMNPFKEFLDLDDDPDLKLSIRLYMDLGSASQAAYMAARAAILERWPESTVLTYDQVSSRVQQLTAVVPIVHDMCVNSCMGYTGPLAELHQCLFCTESRYDEVKSRAGKLVPRQTFYTIPIGTQVQALWRNRESAKLMSYRKEKTREMMDFITREDDGSVSLNIEVFDDYVCGSDYLTAVLDGRISDDDMVLVLSADGAQLYKNKGSDCWIYIWVIMDLPPGARYKKRHVIPAAFIPGPNNPRHFDSFSFPSFQHLAALQKTGLRVWDPINKRVFASKLFLLYVTADATLASFLALAQEDPTRAAEYFAQLEGCKDASSEIRSLRRKVTLLIDAVNVQSNNSGSAAACPPLTYPKPPPKPKTLEEQQRVFWAPTTWKNHNSAGAQASKAKSTIIGEAEENEHVDGFEGGFGEDGDDDEDAGEDGGRGSYLWMGFLVDLNGVGISIPRRQALADIYYDFFVEALVSGAIDIHHHTWKRGFSLTLRIRLSIIIEGSEIAVAYCDGHWKFDFCGGKFYNAWRNKILRRMKTLGITDARLLFCSIPMPDIPGSLPLRGFAQQLSAHPFIPVPVQSTSHTTTTPPVKVNRPVFKPSFSIPPVPAVQPTVASTLATGTSSPNSSFGLALSSTPDSLIDPVLLALNTSVANAPPAQSNSAVGITVSNDGQPPITYTPNTASIASSTSPTPVTQPAAAPTAVRIPPPPSVVDAGGPAPLAIPVSTPSPPAPL